jgi:hypothetical protein
MSILAVMIIASHILAYKKDVFGIDQLIPSILGYFSIWAILMTLDLGEKSK